MRDVVAEKRRFVIFQDLTRSTADIRPPIAQNHPWLTELFDRFLQLLERDVPVGFLHRLQRDDAEIRFSGGQAVVRKSAAALPGLAFSWKIVPLQSAIDYDG